MLLAFRLLITPLCIGSVTLAGRRWGPGISGLLTGLPLTSGPILAILSLQHGPAFAASTAIGTLAGEASVCAFCLGYTWTARRANCWLSAGVGTLSFVMATVVSNRFTWSLLPAFICLLLVIGLVLRFIPDPTRPLVAVKTPAWDLPARMFVAATFVLVLTHMADSLGPQLSGLIAPFPVFAMVLAVFAHRQQGAEAAVLVLRGVVTGLSATACFLVIVGGLVTVWPLLWTYALATACAIAVTAASYHLGRRRRRPNREV